MRKVSIYTHATTISPQMSTAMVSLAFRSGTISSDIILWVLFLLSTALLSALVVHERDGIFFQDKGYTSQGSPGKWNQQIAGESERERSGGRGRQNTYNMYLYIIYLLYNIFTVVGGYFKELAHAVMDIGKFKICRVGQQAGDSGKSQCFSSGPEAV